MSGAPGQQIRTRLVQTNAFELKWNASKKVYHYDGISISLLYSPVSSTTHDSDFVQLVRESRWLYSIDQGHC